MELSTYFEPSKVYKPFHTSGAGSLSKNGLLVTISNEDHVAITNIHSGDRIGEELPVEDTITSVEISPDGNHVVACSRNAMIIIYERVTEESGYTVKKKISKAHGGGTPVIVCKIDPTSSLLATGGAEGGVKVWDLRGGYVTHSFTGHGGVISALAFHVEGNNWKLASGSEDCKIRIWDLVKSKSNAILDGGHVSVIRGLEFNEDGTYLLSAGRDKVVNIWEGKTLKKTIPVLESIEVVGYHHHDDVIYTAGEQGLVKLWDVKSGEMIVSSGDHKETNNNTDDDDDNSMIIQIMRDDDDIMYAVYADQTITGFKASLDNITIDRRIAGTHGEIVDCVCLNDDQRLILATNSSPALRIVSKAQNMVAYDVLMGHTDIVLSIDRSQDGRWIASAGKDQTVRLWDLNTSSSSTMVFRGHVGSVGAVAIPKNTATPKWLLTGSADLTIKRWNLKTGTADYTKKAHEKDINALDISSDGKLFASASQDRTIKIWDSETGEVVGILRGHRRGVWAVKFSPYDRNVIISGAGDKTVRMWSLKDMSCSRTFEGHSNSVLKVGFLPNNRQIVSAAGDGLVKIWDTKSGELNTTLDNHEDKVWSLTIDPTSGEIISAGGDSVITIWGDYTVQHAQEEAKNKELQVEQEQEFENLIRSGKYKEAVLIGLNTLNQPLKLLKVFNQMDDEALSQLIQELEDDNLIKLLDRVKDWNTRARTSRISQRIVYQILYTHSTDDLLRLPGIMKIIDALLPYSQRHYTKVQNIQEDGYLVDYVIEGA